MKKGYGKSILLYLLGGVCLFIAAMLGVQKNVYFAAVSFLSFFVVGVMLLMQANACARGKVQKKRSDE